MLRVVKLHRHYKILRHIRLLGYNYELPIHCEGNLLTYFLFRYMRHHLARNLNKDKCVLKRKKQL